MSVAASEFDFIIIGAGSAGCALAFQLANANLGTIAVVEAGGTDGLPHIKMPFGLLYTMGSKRDWNLASTPQKHSNNRSYKIPRGKMLGGSSSINSMVWFRGRQDDFDNWGVRGWSWKDVEPAFMAVEAEVTPGPLPDPHPMSKAFGKVFRANEEKSPSPEYESAGIFEVNMRRGRRWSAADAFLRPAIATGRVKILKNFAVEAIEINDSCATAIRSTTGRRIVARKEIILSAGSIGSPEILLHSGVGPAEQLHSAGVNIVFESDLVGRNLHDHPAVGIHFVGDRTGYGLTMTQLLPWVISPFQWLVTGKGRMASNFVEAGAFLRSDPDRTEIPDVQVHFFPYMMGWKGSAITVGSGYFADVCVSRPKSRGTLSLGRDASGKLETRIDLGIFADPDDLEILTNGWKRLRHLLESAPFNPKGREAWPGEAVRTDDQIKEYIRSSAGTAYHPVGTLRMGDDKLAPVDGKLRLRGIDRLRVADASIMPQVTSANTNAPAMMIGWRAGEFIKEDWKNA